MRDPINELFHLAFNVDNLRLVRLHRGGGSTEPVVPQFLEHRTSCTKETLRRRQPLQQLAELALQNLAAYGLPIAHAPLVGAQVIWEPILPASDRPTRRHRAAAIATENESSQWEIGRDVLTRRNSGALGQSLLNPPVGLGADKGFVMALAQRYSPARRLDEAGIDWAGEHVRYSLKSDRIAPRSRKLRPRLQEPLDLRLDLKPPAGESFERILDDGGQRFAPDQHLALAVGFRIAVAHRYFEHVKALLNACFHLLDGLAAALQTFKLTLGGDDGLDKFAFGRILELEVEAFDSRVMRR